jgi:hypothetical protein
MTVTLETIGGGGLTLFPPKNSQLADFEDDFRRPIGNPDVAAIDGNSLGPNWVPQWLQAVNPNFPMYPSITLNEQCAFRCNGQNTAVTACWPLQLAWLGYWFYPSYCQLRMRQRPPGTGWRVDVALCYSHNPGTTGYKAGISSQPGWFALTFEPSDDPGMTRTRLLFLQMFSNLTEDYPQFVVLADLPDAPLGTLKRLEARGPRDPRDWPGYWDLRCFFGMTEVYARPVSPQLAQGVPAMVCGLGGNNPNFNPVALVDDFQAGWLR